jgi:hypothetical protein
MEKAYSTLHLTADSLTDIVGTDYAGYDRHQIPAAEAVIGTFISVE